jgi:hypothetical protein
MNVQEYLNPPWDSVYVLACVHHGPPHAFKDARMNADGLKGGGAKCLFVLNRGWMCKGVYVSQQAKIRRIPIWREHWTREYLAQNGCSTAMRVPELNRSSSFPLATTEKLSVSGHSDIDIFHFVLICGTRVQSLPSHFTYTLYLHSISSLLSTDTQIQI